MPLRPVPARWFELVTARDDLTRTLEALARTGSVELEIRSDEPARLSLADLHTGMAEYHRLATRYHRYWPQMAAPLPPASGSPLTRLEAALERLRSWERRAAALTQQLEAARAEQAELQLLALMLAHLPDESLDFALLAAAGPSLAARLYVMPADSPVPRLSPGVLVQGARIGQRQFMLALGLRAAVDALAAELAAHKGRAVAIPPDLRGGRAAALEQMQERLQHLEARAAALRTAIDAVSDEVRLVEALADIRHLDWFLAQVTELPVSEHFAWISGWTSDVGGERLERALEASGVAAVIDFPRPPAQASAPLVMRNPWWAQPYELFARLLGTPGADEADPSRLLALLVPLLFGYMFGDVGQGGVLLLAGVLLQRRWPPLRLLVANGLAAMLFGLVFGSVFGREDLIPALWVHPLEHPLPVLLLPLGGGVLVLLLGLALGGLEAWWRGTLRHWAQVDAAVIVLYVSLIVVLFERRALLIGLLALLWYVLGGLSQGARRGWQALAALAGGLVESVFQLLVNTVSFVRVGAFALAHAGLSLAFVSLAGISDNAVVGLLVMLFGNLIIIMLEGLVVSVQTTRLVLFEFFIRFLRGTGRVFRPLLAPAGELGLRRQP